MGAVSVNTAEDTAEHGPDDEFAVYAAPDVKGSAHTEAEHSEFLCQTTRWGGLHITLCGFQRGHASIGDVLGQLSKCSSTPWHVAVHEPRAVQVVANRFIDIESTTLNAIANALATAGLSKVKGPEHTGKRWHITSDSVAPPSVDAVRELLRPLHWSLVEVRRRGDDGSIEWMARYPLMRLSELPPSPDPPPEL